MSNVNFEVFRHQFYLGSTIKTINENWCYLPLKNGLILSYHKDLSVFKTEDKTGFEWVLIGDAVQSLKNEPDPEVQLKEICSNLTIREIYKSWVGRWVLLNEEELHLDAAGLFGCYYKLSQDGIEIASVPSLIADKEMPDTYRIKKSVGIEFYPLPDSGFSGISKLLPSQLLKLKTGEIRWRPLSCAIPELSYTEKITFLSELLTTTINKYKDNKYQFKLALTAGCDSRLLMAALNSSNIQYEAYTFHHPLINSNDASIPRKLAAISKRNYQLIKRKKPLLQNWDKFDKHSSYHAIEIDQQMMMHQQYDQFENNDALILRGGGFEIASSKVRTRLPKEIADGATIAAILNGNEKQGISLQKWVDWVKMHPEENVDWRDRFYWEQRVAGWLSSTEQALDLVNAKRIVPANSLLFYNIMLSLPEEIRLNKVHQKDMIQHLDASLLQVPINPPSSFLSKQYRKLLVKLLAFKKRFSQT